MAEAATLERNRYQTIEADEIDRQFEGILEASGYARAPESEVYGRSLGTIYRLGAFMMGKSLSEIPNSPEAAQARVEFYTSVEEGFGTDMELGGGLEVRDFDSRPIIDGKVMAKDLKTAVSSMTEAGLKCGEETLKRDKRFAPQLVRSHWDHENALTVDKMARGETDYNMRIVVSPFPEEAAKQSGDDYWRNIGYVPHLKRGFVQLYYADGKQIISGSLSFNGSDKHRLRELFGEFGIKVPETEVTDNWLQYAITDTLSVADAKALSVRIADMLDDPSYKKAAEATKIKKNTVDITREYGAIMDRVFDDSYIHVCESLARGAQTDALVGLVHQLADKAHHFNKHYSSALYRMRADKSRFSDEDSAVMHELLVYSTIEMMRALHLETTGQTQLAGDLPIAVKLQALNPATFQAMLSGFGADGAKNNRVYSACGLAIKAGGDNREGGPQTAFGGADGESESDGDGKKKWMSCPFCTEAVYDDPCANVLQCNHCKAKVVNGVVVYKGNGGPKKAKVAAVKEKRTEISNPNLKGSKFEKLQLKLPEAKAAPTYEEVYHNRQAVGMTAVQAPV